MMFKPGIAAITGPIKIVTAYKNQVFLLFQGSETVDCERHEQKQ